MLAISPEVKIFLHAEPIDMRKSFDGLFGIIKLDLSLDVRDGGLFLFLNLRRKRMKILYWDRDRLAIWMKKQKPEDTHFDIFTEVRLGRTFREIVDETRSSHF